MPANKQDIQPKFSIKSPIRSLHFTIEIPLHIERAGVETQINRKLVTEVK